MKTTTKISPAQAKAIIAEATQAAEIAAQNAIPVPMVVGTAIGFSDKIDYSKPVYYESEGLCGFAWVKITPARGSFVAYLKSQNIGHPAYQGGYEISAWEIAPSLRGSQSVTRKEAAANAAAAVFQKYGINAYGYSRLD